MSDKKNLVETKVFKPEDEVYVNYQCRRCGATISRKIPRKYLNHKINQKGVYSSNKSDFHKCPKAIEQEEHVMYDLLSWSEEPIVDAEVSVWKVKEEGNNSNAGDSNRDEK